MSTQKRLLLFLCVSYVYILFLCVSYAYIFILFLSTWLCLYTSQIFVWYKTFDFRMVQNIFFPIYSAKFRIKYPTNETKLIHKLRRTNLPRNNFCKCLMFSKIFLSLNSSVHLSTTLVQHGTIISLKKKKNSRHLKWY